jgi:4-hydroxybenzoate polyprenyltransferase
VIARASPLLRLWAYVALIHPYPVALVTITAASFGLLAAGGAPRPGWLFRLVGVVLLSQICVGITNDLHDLPLDRHSKPHKPLVAGRVRSDVARVIAWVAGLSALTFSMSFGPVGLLGALLGTGAGLLYNYRLKGTVFSWLPYAVGFSLLPLCPFIALGLWSSALAWTCFIVLPASIALNLAQSLDDLESDGVVGVTGLANRLGPRWAPIVTWVACGIAVALALLRGVESPRARLLVSAAAVTTCLVSTAALHYHRRPGPGSRVLAWRLVAAGIAILGVGWVGAVVAAIDHGTRPSLAGHLP